MESPDTSPPPDLSALRRRFPRKLRRAQAVTLAQALGFTAYTFRTLAAAGRISAQHIIGKRAHYDREQIISALS